MAFLLSADDFGLETQTNQAVIKLHQAGVVQAAGLMMGEAGTEEAVALAKANPSLQVGLHLVLVDGKSVLPYAEIPDLIDFSKNFPRDPALTWFSYFFNRKLRRQLEKEIHAQFEAFRRTGLPLSHVDGHHHQHLHPSIFKWVVKLAKTHGARWIRVPRESLNIWGRSAPHPSLLKRLHGMIYYGLTRGKKSWMSREGFLTFDGVFGFLETHAISKDYILNLLAIDPPGLHELYTHPGAKWNHDEEILIDPEIQRALKAKKLPLERLDSMTLMPPEP